MSRRGWTLFAIMSVIWGIPYLLIKVADGGVSVPVLVWARVTLGALVLVPAAVLWRPAGTPPAARQLAALRACWPWLVAFAAVEIIAPWALLSSAERRLSSSTSGLLIAAVPVIAAILARVSGGERLSPVRWAGLAAGFGGVALLAGPGTRAGDLVAVGEVVATAFCYAIGPMIANRKLAGVPSISVNAACLTMAAIVYTPAAVLTWPHAMPSARVLAALAGLGVICTATGLVLFFALIAEAGPARALVITYVNPAVAVALGALVLGEQLTPAIGVAFALILAGSVLATRGRAVRRRSPLPPSVSGPLSGSPERARTSAPDQ